ncbi:MAG TPA: DUF711 family protein [Anaerolineaceae bacterium]|nr:DUF711 family protein [Anaerolineaceae bacterium]
MKIRSITVFCEPGYPVNRLLLQQVGIFATHARKLYEEAGFEVQSLRLATPPFGQFVAPIDLPDAVQSYAIEAHADGFEYISLGPASSDPTEWAAIPGALKRSNRVFLSGSLTTQQGELDLANAARCAETIVALSKLEPDGFANLRFCALANVPACTPFFPAAYAQREQPAFALALEAADLALTCFSQAKSLQEARQCLIDTINENAARLEAVGEKLEKMYGYLFKGLDFTLAPHPDQTASIGSAIEALGLPAFGPHGSLFASTFLTSSLQQAQYRKIGFNGLMLPVLEDSTLALRAAEGSLSLTELLMFSAVCGAGLDVIPLPGDTSPEEIYPILLDLGALALRLNKPLTARLMPVPGKQAGDPTTFDFGYFANSRVMPLQSQKLSGLMLGSEKIKLPQREDQG